MPKVKSIRKNKFSKLAVSSARAKALASSYKDKLFSNVVKISKDNCKGCALCIAYCPKAMLKIDSNLNKLGFHPVVFNHKNKNNCIGCRFCVLVCPDGCIELLKNE